MPSTSWESYFSGNTVSDIPQSMAPAARHPQNIYLTTHKTLSGTFLKVSAVDRCSVWTKVHKGSPLITPSSDRYPCPHRTGVLKRVSPKLDQAFLILV